MKRKNSFAPSDIRLSALLEALAEESNADIVFKKENPKLYNAAKRAKKSDKDVISKDGPGSGADDSVVLKKGTKVSDLEEMAQLMGLATESEIVEALRKSIRNARRK